jgi:hypothetical protein
MILPLAGIKLKPSIQDFTVDFVNHKYTFEEIVSAIQENAEKL